MFSREVPWTFYCKTIEIPQKLHESNSESPKYGALKWQPHPPPPKPTNDFR